jgi:membrane dipeptidase
MTESTTSHTLRIDGLEYSIWDRTRFLEWRDGGLDAVHVTLAIWETARDTLRTVGEWSHHFHDNADLIMPARTPADILEAKRDGKTAVILGLQNTTPFEDDLDLVWGFHHAGIRIAQLTYNIQNSVGAGCWEAEDSGLSSHYGKQLVREMNQAGMLIDISHCGERTCMGAIEASELPIALTHGNPREFVGMNVELAMRNRSTELIKLLAERGGMIGLSMYPRLAPGGNDCTLELFCDMVAWTVDLIGVEHVGIGTDLYLGHEPDVLKWWRMGRWSREVAIPISGLPKFPSWMESPAQFRNIEKGLAAKGLSEQEVALIMGGNFFNLFERVFGNEHRSHVSATAAPAAVPIS